MNRHVQQMTVSGVRKMFELAAQMQNPIDLSLGQPDFPAPMELKEAAVEAIRNDCNRYAPTTGLPALKKRIVQKLREENHITATEDQVIITSAVSGALSIILCTILNEGDEVVLPDPYFVSYRELVIQNRGIPKYVRTAPDFSLDIPAIENALTPRTKAILINSPNNPTGKVYDEQQLRELVSVAIKHDVLIISDEIYEKFVYGKTHFSIGSIYPKTVTLNGFSKSYAVPGWRLGYCVAPLEIIQEAIKVQQFNFVCAPVPFQHAAIRALDIDMRPWISGYEAKKNIVYEGLKDHYTLIQPEGAFYAFARYPYEKERFLANCIAANVLVVPGSTFSQEDTHFRLSFATSDENLKKGMEILRQVAEKK